MKCDYCVKKFEYFLPRFKQVLKDPDWERGAWEDEVGDVLLGYRTMYSPATRLTRHPEIGLIIIETTEPVHYYSLFSRTSGFDIVLTCYDNNRYELEYKYTTWVDISSRPTLPRLPLAPIAAKLNTLEKSNRTWTYDAVTETGPLLRLQGDTLNREEAYDNPTQREIYSSTIEATDLKKIVVEHYREAYQSITPKYNWTWKEVKALGHQE